MKPDQNAPRAFVLDLIPIINGQFVDGDNVGGLSKVKLQVTINSSNTTITHNLGRVPNGYKVFRNGNGGVVYDSSAGTANWTTTTMDLRSTVTGNVVSLEIW